jgi:hypothetical protein
MIRLLYRYTLTVALLLWLASSASGQVNVYPADAAINISTTPVLELDCAPAGRTATHFQIASDAGFASIAYDSGEAPNDICAHVVPTALNSLATYYWRVRVKDTFDVWSAWSTATTFVTANATLLATASFQDGGNGYAGTSDTDLRGSGANPLMVIREWNQGAQDVLRTGRRPPGQPTDEVYRSLVRFDLQTLTDSTIIVNAWLELTGGTHGPVEPVFDELNDFFVVLTPWGEGDGLASEAPTAGEASWTYRSFTDTWSVVGAAGVGTDREGTPVMRAVLTNDFGYNVAMGSQALVTAIQGWVDTPADNHGILFKAADESFREIMNIASREFATFGHRPRLVIQTLDLTCSGPGDCDDGLFCNGAEQCVASQCEPGIPVDCDDGIACTIDACNEAADACDNTVDHASCDDGLFCNGAETCDAVLGCSNGTDPCDDGIACTADSCNDAKDTCGHVADDGACDDGSFCNGAETCDAVLDCQSGRAPDCNDGVACTIDSCDNGLATCVHTADDGACDDGLFCNGAETCDVALDCQSAIAPDCDDGVACTVDSCDNGLATCVHTADDGACDDGSFCNGAETCNAVLDCQSGPVPDCDDGVSCTADSCDDGLTTCVNLPDDSPCDDGLFCNGAESCDSIAGCVFGPDPCPGQLCLARRMSCCFDDDGDGVCNASDQCNGFDDDADIDNDGVADGCDNCMNDPNPVQLDCDNDGTGDVCALLQGSVDCNLDSVPDECTPTSSWVGADGAAYEADANWTPFGIPLTHATMSHNGADDVHATLDADTTQCTLLVEATAAGIQSLEVTANGRLSVTEQLTVASGGRIDLRDGEIQGNVFVGGAGLNGTGRVVGSVTNTTSIGGSSQGVLRFSGGTVVNTVDAVLSVPVAGLIQLDEALDQQGTIMVGPQGGLVGSRALTNRTGGVIALSGGAIGVPNLQNEPGANISGFGIIDSELTNDGTMTSSADLQLTGDADGSGSWIVQNGLTTFLGDVSTSGSITASVGAAQSSSGVAVLGDCTFSAGATLTLPQGRLRVGGHFSVAIDDVARLDVVDGVIQVIGVDGSPQNIEVTAPDVGPEVMLPDLHTLGTLRIGPTLATARLIDAHPNTALPGPEALYVINLVIDPGMTLDLNGINLYYCTVSPPDPLSPGSGVSVVDSAGTGSLTAVLPQQYGDVNQNDARSLDDLLCVLDGFQGAFPLCTPTAVDVAPCGGDGLINVDDILAVLEALAGRLACPEGCP